MRGKERTAEDHVENVMSVSAHVEDIVFDRKVDLMNVVMEVAPKLLERCPLVIAQWLVSQEMSYSESFGFEGLLSGVKQLQEMENNLVKR